MSSIRVSIGDTSEISTRTARATAKEYLAQISRGRHPKPAQNGLSGSSENAENKAASADATLKQAWRRYLEAHLVRKNRSERTIAGYRDHVERIFAEWLDTPLAALGSDPTRVAKKHDDVTLTPSDANSVTIASESPRPQTSRPNRGPGLSTRSVPDRRKVEDVA